jgi:hypothetical protein
MGEPVLVIHGVSNRDPAAFEALVGDLSRSLDDAWDLIPAFWGDLGGNPVGIPDTIPDPGAAAARGLKGEDQAVAAALLSPNALGIGGTSGETPTRRAATDKRDIVADAAAESVVAAAPTATRGPSSSDDVRQAVRENWDTTEWLPRIQDKEVLRTIGQVIGDNVGRTSEGTGAGPAVRGFGDVAGFVKGMLSDLDKAVGAVIGKAAGNFNHFFREYLVPTLIGFGGDVLVYEHQWPKIQERIRSVLEEKAPGYGIEDRPIPVIAHSLGGVIAFDSAVASDPKLWISALVTFGSQAPFFHVVDARADDLAPYTPGHPVTLPASIGKWTNLWEPLDPLAFIAAKVFRLHGGDPPADRPVHHLASSGLWTHTVYWQHADLVTAIRETLA